MVVITTKNAAECTIAVVLVCAALVIVGVAAVVRWGGTPFPPPPEGHGVAVYVWYLATAVMSGVAAGITIAGAGGRLAMRLVAATSPESAQGVTTEAEETVGRITTGGSVGFVIFTALFFGLATGVLYLLIRRWLPAGRLSGLAYGLLLLVVFATRVDPLRADNRDFDIVGPSGVALAVFGALVVVHGMAVAAIAARYASALPVIGRDVRVVARYLPMAPLLLFIPFTIMAIVGGAAFVAARSAPGLVADLHSPRATVAGRVVLGLVVIVCIPGFVSAVIDIAGRGP